ncbi:TlpA disulfide reductase family protein [Salegentibacter sp. Hel_I_6]|uniref:TlpA disulfide reductase family protein n=1 Tax=Salegentibacter sp. Hel_I_6 TaxID=1250278 RepID=UPI00069140A8|nr:TlpA disulfide reductase family protein [Salegentibacter sp. Hel_I_6]
MRVILIIFSSLFILSSLQAQESFSLAGKTSDIKDGSWLYFQDLVNGGTIDSAEVKNNSFKFNTKLPQARVWVMLHTKDRSKFTEVWLQDTPMYFDASKTEFQDAKITGSVSHQLVEKEEAIYLERNKLSDKELETRQKQFIQNNTNALISARMLYEVSGKWGKDSTAHYFEMFPEEIKKSAFGERIISFLENENIPQIGEKYNDFQATNPAGKQPWFSELTGKVTLLQFWSSTCNPSKLQNKELKKLYKKFKADGFEIVAISRDETKEDWINTIEKDNLNWYHLSSLEEGENPVFKNYGISRTPSNYLLDNQGKVVARDLRGEKLEEEVKNLLK